MYEQPSLRPSDRPSVGANPARLLAVSAVLAVGLAGEAAEAPAGTGGFDFEDPVEVGVVPDPTRAATADLDGLNGNDVVITSLADTTGDPGQLFALLNDGSGVGYEFLPSTVGVEPVDVVLDDFDGINGPDAAVANAGDGTVAILLNLGAAPGGGIFGDPAFVGVGNRPVAVASGDLTLDQIPDLAVGNHDDNTVSILQGRGDGTFFLRLTLQVGGPPTDLTIAEFAQTRGLELMVVLEDSTYEVYQSDGKGGLVFFDGGELIGVPGFVEPEDVDGDKDIDAVVLGDGAFGPGEDGTRPAALTILVNQSGDGFFELPFPAGEDATSLTVGDFDDDGDPDALVVAGRIGGERGVQVLENLVNEKGEIIFIPGPTVDPDPNQRLAAGELLGGTSPDRDLVTIDVEGDPARGNVSVLLGVPSCAGDVDGDGTVGVGDLKILLRDWGACPPPCPPTCAADINGDCTVDMIDLLTVLASWGPCP